MKLCVFSDIHGNGPAFDAALEMIMSENADINIFLGDLCGYYFDQVEILSMLNTIPNFVAILGNHDMIFLEIINGNEDLRQAYAQKYGNSMEYLLERDTFKLVTWLVSIPDFHVNHDLDVAAYHGSPWDILEGYVYPDTLLEDFVKYPFTFFCLGHTHYPMVKEIGNKLIINPGSIGQPRTGGWPTYAIVDLPKREVSFREVFYNNEQILNQIDKIDSNNKYLKDVIMRKPGNE